MDTSSPQKTSSTAALRHALAAILGPMRRVLGSVYQLVFRDRLRDIDQQTERLGSASVEAVTHLGSEVRTLEVRLEAIERRRREDALREAQDRALAERRQR